MLSASGHSLSESSQRYLLGVERWYLETHRHAVPRWRRPSGFEHRAVRLLPDHSNHVPEDVEQLRDLVCRRKKPARKRIVPYTNSAEGRGKNAVVAFAPMFRKMSPDYKPYTPSRWDQQAMCEAVPLYTLPESLVPRSGHEPLVARVKQWRTKAPNAEEMLYMWRLVQNSKEWFDARSGQIGASSLGPLFNRSKFKDTTFLSLLKVMVGAAPPDPIPQDLLRIFTNGHWGEDIHGEVFRLLSGFRIFFPGMVINPAVPQKHTSPDQAVEVPPDIFHHALIVDDNSRGLGEVKSHVYKPLVLSSTDYFLQKASQCADVRHITDARDFPGWPVAPDDARHGGTPWCDFQTCWMPTTFSLAKSGPKRASADEPIFQTYEMRWLRTYAVASLTKIIADRVRWIHQLCTDYPKAAYLPPTPEPLKHAPAMRFLPIKRVCMYITGLNPSVLVGKIPGTNTLWRDLHWTKREQRTPEVGVDDKERQELRPAHFDPDWHWPPFQAMHIVHMTQSQPISVTLEELAGHSEQNPWL